MSLFGKKTHKSNRKLVSRNKRLGFESMEARQMMTIVPITGIIAPIDPVFELPPPGPMAEGTVNFNASSGVLDIDLSQSHDNKVQIFINHRAGNGAGNLPDLLTVDLANINTPQVWAFDPTAVTRIVVHSHDGNDFVDNRTSVPMVAYGGTGNDTFLGGSGDDILIAGSGNCYLDGRQGDDMLFGGSGSSALFGGDGNDSLYAGAGTNFLFGGSGDDHLYAGTGHSRLEGEAGLNAIIDPNHVGIDYTGFGPAAHVDVNGFSGFDFFDRNLKDSADSSLARLDYFEHNALTRDDMLGIYSEISTDGVESAIPYNGTVTGSEYLDLKALTSGQLNIDQPTRYLAMKVAYGDPANAHYQGQALGNLAPGCSGNSLTELVDKWFEGLDLPAIGDTPNFNVQYGQVSGNLFGPNGPQYTDVAQGFVGDCYLMSALGEEAQHSPQTIENMFIDNGDGTYTVKFYHNRAPVYVTINSELPLNMNDGGTAWFADFGTPDTHGVRNKSDNANNVLWVALAEKAYAQLNESGWIGQDGTNSYNGIDGGQSSAAFAQLTGHSASDTGVTNLFGDSRSDFWKAFNQHKAMTLSSKISGTNSFIVTNHVYMVVGYDSATQRYELYNPWGYDDTGNKQPAIVWETWPEIRHDFDYWTSVLL
jgi:hypothetical protein